MVVVFAFSAALALPGAVAARPRPRSGLTVSSGSVGAVNGTLKGSFVVRNRSGAGTGGFAAELVVGGHGEDRVAKRFSLRPLASSATRTVRVAVAMPSGLSAGSWSIRACVDQAHRVRERSERNNCRRLGTIAVGAGPGSSASSFPTDPIPFTAGVPFTLDSPQGSYQAYVPGSYDATHATPTPLFVWLHGCGGFATGDIYTVSPRGGQDWISVAVGGREGQCWDPNADQAKVLAAIADVKTHFNVDPRRVILGGYSSGGDLAYRTAFYDARAFAGLLVENTSPFRDTGSSQSASLAAAAWKFNVVHLAHLQDTTYPIAGVRKETEAMVAAGFPLTRIEVDGGHYDEPWAIENGHSVPGTTADVATYLLSHIDDGWLAP